MLTTQNAAAEGNDGQAPIVAAYGMGVDSTAMLIGWHAAGMPAPDAILFADTGSEKPETYRYLDVINKWLTSIGYPSVTVIKRASPRAGDTSLHGECLRKSVLPSLAYGGHSCSLKWKVDPQWAWVKKQYGWTRPRKRKGETETPAGRWTHGASPLVKLIGYDSSPADLRRVRNAVGKWPPGHAYRYPLVEWGWDRRRCIEVIRNAGLPGWNPAHLNADLVTFKEMEWIECGGIPMKSACFMCPGSKKAEIQWLQERHPLLYGIAIKMEDQAKARGLKTVKGLGRNFAWSETGCDCDGVAFPAPARRQGALF